MSRLLFEYTADDGEFVIRDNGTESVSVYYLDGEEHFDFWEPCPDGYFRRSVCVEHNGSDVFIAKILGTWEQAVQVARVEDTDSDTPHADARELIWEWSAHVERDIIFPLLRKYERGEEIPDRLELNLADWLEERLLKEFRRAC